MLTTAAEVKTCKILGIQRYRCRNDVEEYRSTKIL